MFYRSILGSMTGNFKKVNSICNGLLDNKRIKSVSVVIFSGIKLSTTIRRGTNILFGCTQCVHNKNILFLKQFDGRKILL